MEKAAKIMRDMAREVARALHGNASLWKVWWLAGIPVAALAYGLGVSAENFRHGEAHFSGALLDTLKFLLCLLWLTVAWRCTGNVSRGLWSGIARCAIAVVLLVVGLTY
jgi:hypothetical protein